MIELRSTIKCPQSNHRSTWTMPMDAFQFIYECEQCRLQLKPGDCCIYCSYGDVPCPPIQEVRAAGADSDCYGSSTA